MAISNGLPLSRRVKQTGVEPLQPVEFVVGVGFLGLQLLDLGVDQGGVYGTHDDLTKVLITRDRLAGLAGSKQEREQLRRLGVLKKGIRVENDRAVVTFKRAGTGLAVEGVGDLAVAGVALQRHVVAPERGDQCLEERYPVSDVPTGGGGDAR